MRKEKQGLRRTLEERLLFAHNSRCCIVLGCGCSRQGSDRVWFGSRGGNAAVKLNTLPSGLLRTYCDNVFIDQLFLVATIHSKR